MILKGKSEQEINDYLNRLDKDAIRKIMEDLMCKIVCCQQMINYHERHSNNFNLQDFINFVKNKENYYKNKLNYIITFVKEKNILI